MAEADGGSGGDHLAYCLVLEELGRGDSAVRGIVSVSLGLVAKSIAAHGSAASGPSGCLDSAPAAHWAASR
ncbi:acyl-CoA dehydrogenase family protein [Micromonospora sp. M12]